MAYTAEESWKVKPFPVAAMKGFGGGDGYASACLHGLMTGRSLPEALEMGSASAAMLGVLVEPCLLQGYAQPGRAGGVHPGGEGAIRYDGQTAFEKAVCLEIHLATFEKERYRTCKRLKPFINGQFIDSVSTKYNKIFDPSTGEQIAQVPACTREELESAIQAAKAAYPAWSATPVRKRAQLMLRLRELIVRDMESLTLLCATENGKTLAEAAGDVGKALEMTELAANAPMQLMGDSLMNTSTGYDTTTYREPLGVFAGIAPWNFPAMIPVGWMAPLCIVCGNTFVLKPASTTPMTCLKFAELYKEAGFPDGVLNIVPCSRNEAELLMSHPDIKGISFVGSTSVGLHVYQTAAANGKRVQALCEAKNHALVLRDAPHYPYRRGHHEFSLRLRRGALHGAACRGGGGLHRRSAGG